MKGTRKGSIPLTKTDHDHARSNRPGERYWKTLSSSRHSPWISFLVWHNSFSSKQQASFNFMAAVTISSDFGAPQDKICHCFRCSPIYLCKGIGQDAMILVFWMLSFKLAFSLSSFTFIKKLLNSSISAMKVVSSAYLRLFIFLLAILIPIGASSSLAFRVMYFACKLNKQMTIYSLAILLILFGISVLFYVWFYMLLLDLHTGFSGGRLVCLVFPSL